MQNWDPPTKGPRSTHLNQDIKRMLKTAKNYNMNLAALRIAPDINAQLPTWYHVKSKPRPLTSIPTRCLLKNHKIRTVADLIRMSARAQLGHNGSHIPNLTCTCIDCIRDHLVNCWNPHQFTQEALTHITKIAPKFNPLLRVMQRFYLTNIHTRQLEKSHHRKPREKTLRSRNLLQN